MADGVPGSKSPANVRVLVADDNFLMRDGLTRMFASSDEVDLVGSCSDLDSAFAAVEEMLPDVVLTDLHMPPTFGDEGLKLSHHLRSTHPAIGVVLLSQTPSVRVASELIRDGAEGRGYLLKDRVADLSELVETLHAVSVGECVIDPGLVRGLVDSKHQLEAGLERLTDRQLDLLADIAEGKSNQAIAEDRVLTVRAVEKHVSEIFARLGINGDERVSRRVRAALLYLESVAT